VDTSAWVQFFNRPDSEHHEAVAELLDEDRIAIIGVIAAELVRGCRTAEEREAVESALEGLHRYDIGFTHWVRIGRELFELRRSGITVALSDAAIAHAAREATCLLYTLDADFRHFAGLSYYP
jgi:predicted nucleic acid-binding protein